MAAEILHDIRRAQRAEGPSAILAIGTANPNHVVDQQSYPDYYFRVTNNDHKQELKAKFKRICDKTMITKRHMHLNEDILKENPSLYTNTVPSLNTRQDIQVEVLPELGKEAANKAIKEWGRPKSMITHLIFASITAGEMPGFDSKLVELLGLPRSVKRISASQIGCHGGVVALRVAKDIAENNKGARVLVVAAECTLVFFQGPELESLVGHALFGDGAAAAIVGADPIQGVEKPIFYMVSEAEFLVPDTREAMSARVRDTGALTQLLREVPGHINDNIEKFLMQVCEPLGIKGGWNSLFWVVHPGGREILDQVEMKLKLKPEKLHATREVLSEFGNMEGVTIFFVMDEMRKQSVIQAQGTTGEGLDWGVLCAFGPGITMETIVLHSAPL